MPRQTPRTGRPRAPAASSRATSHASRSGRQLLVRHSAPYLPAQLAVVPADGGSARELTDTRTPAFKAMGWIAPQFVQIPSTHGAGTLWAKYYAPATLEAVEAYKPG